MRISRRLVSTAAVAVLVLTVTVTGDALAWAAAPEVAAAAAPELAADRRVEFWVRGDRAAARQVADVPAPEPERPRTIRCRATAEGAALCIHEDPASSGPAEEWPGWRR